MTAPSASIARAPASAPDRADELEPLFRREVFAEQRAQWLGTVLLAPSLSHRLFAGFAFAAAASVLLFLFFGEFTRRERVNGWLVPDQGMVRVIAPRAGVIGKLHVKDGDAVEAGAPLVTLSAELRSEALGATQSHIIERLAARKESLQRELDRQSQLLREEEASLDAKIAAFALELQQIDEEIAAQQRRTALAKGTAGRYRSLVADGIATAVETDEAESAWFEEIARLKSLQRAQTVIDRDMAAAAAEREMHPLKAETRLAEIERMITTIEQETAAAEAEREILITAPQAGLVAALRAEAGTSVSTAIPMLSIVPDGSVLQAQLFAPSGAVGFLKTGQEVRLRYKAFPYQKFGHYSGKVVGISKSTVSPSELGAQFAGLTSLLRGDEPVYLLTVQLDRQSVVAYGETIALHPGMQLQADILVESRRLIEWVFDPLYTLTGKLGA